MGRGSGSGSGSGWVESTCFPLEEGLPAAYAGARVCACACECACVSEGTRLHSLIFAFFFFCWRRVGGFGGFFDLI